VNTHDHLSDRGVRSHGWSTGRRQAFRYGFRRGSASAPAATGRAGALSGMRAAATHDTARGRRLKPSLSWLALCIAASGGLTYVYLAVVARSLPAEDYGWFGAYWALTLVIGLGAFLPLETELARLIHLGGPAARLPSGTMRAAFAVTCLSLLAVAVSWPLLSDALGGQTGLLVALLAICLASGPQFLLRGLLMGHAAMGWYGAVLVLDTVLRVGGAVAVAALVDPPTVSSFGWTLVVALACAHVPLFAWMVLARRPGSRPDAAGPAPGTHRLTGGAIGHLVLGALSAQALLNAAPVLVTGAADPREGAIAAAFVASFTLVRIPLFLAVPLQSALIRPLLELGGSRNYRHHQRLVLRLLALSGVLATLGALVGAIAGPPLVSLVFGARYALSSGAFAVLVAGSVLHLGLLVSSQALVARSRHRDSAVSWITGLAAAIVLFAVIPDLVTCAAVAFAGGSAVAWASSTLLLLRRVTDDVPGATVPADQQEA
jgi:O-antigen/teichoic acid export membrane protein